MSINLSANQLLDQLNQVLETIGDGDYAKPLTVLSDSSVGQHIRHTLEFFICLIDAKKNGVVNYDSRKHDRLIEMDRRLALSVIKSVRAFIERNTEDFPLIMQANYQFEGSSIQCIPTNYLRELAYNIEHAIHHMALIKIGVRAIDSSFKFPDHFGVASSTVRYHHKH